MSDKKVSKGNANRVSLSDRMKDYESVTTGSKLIQRLPIYARIDMRAGHTWCHGLDKPFDQDYSNSMKSATSYIVEKTGAAVGFCQSDEASFVWLDDTKVPFGTRLFKLESVLASMFTGSFMRACRGTKLEQKMWQVIPSFDCRVMNMPNLDECANAILWRSNDSVKNSITLLALEHFSNKDIHKKNGDEKIKMLKDKRGVDYYSAIPEDLRLGAFFRRETYEKCLTDEEVSKIPEQNRTLSADGKIYVTRSRVSQFFIGIPLQDCANKKDVLFCGAPAISKTESPVNFATFACAGCEWSKSVDVNPLVDSMCGYRCMKKTTCEKSNRY